jgi:hypothetical protein
MIRRILSGGLLSGLILAGIVFYGIPRKVGDDFVAAWQRLDSAALAAQLCADTTLEQVQTWIVREGGNIGAWLGQALNVPFTDALRTALQALQVQASYEPLSGRYAFRWSVRQTIEVLGFRLEGGLTTPEIAFRLRRPHVWSACVQWVATP